MTGSIKKGTFNVFHNYERGRGLTLVIADNDMAV